MLKRMQSVFNLTFVLKDKSILEKKEALFHIWNCYSRLQLCMLLEPSIIIFSLPDSFYCLFAFIVYMRDLSLTRISLYSDVHY